MDGYLKGRSAVVTGGASGQGRAIALALAARGADVAIGSYLADRPALEPGSDTYLPAPDELAAVEAEIAACGVHALGVALDVRSNESCAAFYDRALKAFGKIDILANAAGIGAEQPICGHPDSLWNEVIDTNLTGCYRMIKLLPAGHDRAPLGTHHQHRLDGRQYRRQGQPRLLRIEGGDPRDSRAALRWKGRPSASPAMLSTRASSTPA